MLSKFFTYAVSISVAVAVPLIKRDNTQAVGTNHIKSIVTTLGYQVADNSCSHRDLGFVGHIPGNWYALYGDTLWCAGGVSDPNADPSGFHGMVRDSVSAATSDPLKVHDLNLNKDSPVPHQLQFVPFNASWGEDSSYGFGGTSLVETDYNAATGAIFYLVNANSAGIKGAGVGKVQIINGTPKVTQRLGTNGIWWNTTNHPRYGDVAAYRDPKSGYIYAWGGAPTTITDYVGSQYVYMVRVLAEQAYDLGSYEYFHGTAGWSSTPLTTFTSDTATMWGTRQGQLVWNKFYGCYIFVHLGGNTVYLRTASSLEGP